MKIVFLQNNAASGIAHDAALCINVSSKYGSCRNRYGHDRGGYVDFGNHDGDCIMETERVKQKG